VEYADSDVRDHPHSKRVRGASALVALFAAGLAQAAPAILYTDLAAAPAGAFVTVFGKRLAGAAVVGADVISQTDSQVVLKWKGTSATIGGIAVPVTTTAGRVLEATPSNFGSLVSGVKSGDIIYLHGGTYSSQYGTTTWGSQNLILGSWASTRPTSATRVRSRRSTTPAPTTAPASHTT
jgi:hypothetical protein